jgi:lipopolysaccharide transport system ATP-binding protein
MNSELTGRENIMLRGLYNGFSRDGIDALEADVRDFAELGEFIDLPVRFYSSGMVVRLAFALATAIRPQVLLMDEWFMAGDANFLAKARERMESMVRGADILVLSSHLTSAVLQWCTRVIWMDHGRIVADGPADEVLERYLGRPLNALERAAALPSLPPATEREADPPSALPSVPEFQAPAPAEAIPPG